MNETWTTVVRTAFLFLTIGILASVPAFSQAAYTATQNQPPFSVFAGYSSIDSDYGTKNQAGYIFGVDLTHSYPRFYIDPSLELRATLSPMGENVSENTYQAGFKVAHAFHNRYHPYGEVLFGTGTIRYRAGLQGAAEKSDNSVVPSYGGGIDVDVYKNFSVKADYLMSHWHTGGNVTYSPSGFNFGVVYHLRFGQR